MLVLAVACIGCSSSNTKMTDDSKQGLLKSTYELRLSERYENFLTNRLASEDIQYIKYGDTRTLIIPVDRYFRSNSTQLSDMDCPGLDDATKLIKLYPKSQIYVAAFTDDSRSPALQRFYTQGRAERIISFLWTKDIPAKRLSAQGYGYKFPLASNNQIHSSAYNRRIEIQWTKAHKDCCAGFQRLSGPTS